MSFTTIRRRSGRAALPRPTVLAPVIRSGPRRPILHLRSLSTDAAPTGA